SELHVQFTKPLLPAQECRLVSCGKPQMVESGLPMREPGTGAIGLPDQRKRESGCLMHADQAVPEVKDDREAKHLRVELGTDIQVRNGQTDVVYSTEGQGRAVSSCRRFVRRPGRLCHEGFLPLQRSPPRIGLDRSGAESGGRQYPHARSPL